eukprot:CAMPEP_0202889156 /NCGR_PEP_ID=MMETSP1391-20130828/43559_1 /ASSEMBLY_ACC=CAM_ASM_000867 /TAXON_ID=1034604 /ORGANISM="Chlamydomonas leiostraca, Strain SAG 11-49" /LENGTH=59 /DNA_ID=CAMNT_0049572477 /DNA_START=522 /DNA_END=701 /DNA_ORIENTATION=+
MCTVVMMGHAGAMEHLGTAGPAPGQHGDVVLGLAGSSIHGTAACDHSCSMEPQNHGTSR